MDRTNQGGEAGRGTSQVEGKQEQGPGGETEAWVGSEQRSGLGEAAEGPAEAGRALGGHLHAALP